LFVPMLAPRPASRALRNSGDVDACMEFQQCLWNLFAPCTSTCFFDWQEDKCYLVAHLASPNAGKDRKMLPPSGAGICSILPTCRGVFLTGERGFRNAR